MQPISKTHIILTLVGIIALVWVVIHTKKQQDTQVPAPSAGDQTQMWPSVKVGEDNLNENTGPYTITAVYPVTASTTISGTLRMFVQQQVDQFKEDTSWAADPSIAPAEAAELSLDVTYVEQKNDRADNYVFTVASYTGGAHGLQATKTFSYNETGIPLTLASLFINGEDGLKTIATYVQAQLKTREFAEESWIADGAAPKADNYQNFVVTEVGITFIFDPYQVAPYAAGVQRVDVPVSAFKSIANPELFN